ncbi:hypothetical protein RKD29_006733 [Streptomyces tendae]|uniref:hypothetical protein n=1 Tax=Streptomyces tendae TaxID=1932 RepID=UPI003832D2FC
MCKSGGPGPLSAGARQRDRYAAGGCPGRMPGWGGIAIAWVVLWTASVLGMSQHEGDGRPDACGQWVRSQSLPGEAAVETAV